MSPAVLVQLTRSSDAADLLEDVVALGFEGSVESLGPEPTLAIGAGDHDPETLQRDLYLALEDWIANRRKPLVPLGVRDDLVVLRSSLA